MATWFPVSQLLLVALLSWSVLCFPAKKGWSQHDPYEGGFSNMAAPPGLHYGSSQGAPAQPSSVSSPAASYPYASEAGVYPSAGGYPGSSGPAPGMSSVGSWNAAPAWSPVEESGFTMSGTSQPTPDIGFPAPPFYQAGELDHYQSNMEHGNSEVESEELSLPLPPPPPPLPPFPEPGYQAGELSHYESTFEHGNEERETEEQGFMPPPPFAPVPLDAEAVASTLEGPTQPAPQALTPLKPSFYYRFLTGQLPPGTYTHFQSNYEQGSDHWDEDHYERYHYPEVQSPANPSQTQQDYQNSKGL
ncbi:uncharacterized protein LOC125903600 [Epinephelus fuscoguttatus]|uniref:uncharacterized protein LOC125903600 n=1 Tax=Epinephelus fuscoguttatus TaxID=293821 RepID=UPI0020D0BDD8|nr:uncharacterized protein LOC125903600 [Epinephelus fuscoguttatus]